MTDREGSVLTGVQKAREAGEIRIRFADGETEATVKKGGEQGHE